MPKNHYISIIACVLFALHVTRSYSQTGINTITPNEHSVLDVSSNDRGVLIPRLTDIQAGDLKAKAPAEGMLIYNTDQGCIQLFLDGEFKCLAVSSRADTSQDVWVDDPGNKMVRLGAKSDGSTPRGDGTEVVVTDGGRVGIGTAAPAEKLDVVGNVDFSGALMPDGTAGTEGQVLFSRGSGDAPKWKAIQEVTGTLVASVYIEGTDQGTVSAGSPSEQSIQVPGLTYSINVPMGETRVLNFTVVGYAILDGSSYTDLEYKAGWGTFELFQKVGSAVRNKISSAHASVVDGHGLENVPIPTVLLMSVEIIGGTAPGGTDYTYTVEYTVLTDDTMIVNFDPSGYPGYNEDSEAMLTKMMVDVYKK